MHCTASRLTTEPRTTFPVRGSPAGRDFAFAANRLTNSSAMLSSTMMRSVDMQICPWFMNAPKAAAFTAASRSASSRTISGALPPSSSRTGFRCRPAVSAMMRPTRVEPVKFTRLTAGWAISASTTLAASAGALVTTLTTPVGRPASRRISPIRRWVPGQISDALSTTVLPQASGRATARTPRITGAFQGAMPTTTPAACRTAMAMQPGLSDGITSPVIWVVMAAASRSMLAASLTLNPAHPAVAPVSVIISSVNSATRWSMRPAALARYARRALGPSSDQAGKASRAASQAASASATVAAAARLATSPVIGLRRSKVRPSLASLSRSLISN
jgi:hypothetical protein